MMMPTMNKTLALENQELPLSSGSSIEDSESFMHALASILQGESTDESPLSQQNIELDTEFLEQLMEADMEIIIENLNNLLDELSFEEEFIAEEMLTEEPMLSLLEVLPDIWVKELEVLFESHFSIEGLLEDFEETGDPISLLAILTAFAVKEQQVFDDVQLKGFQAIQQLVSTYFPHSADMEKSSNFRQIVAQIREFFSQTDTSLLRESQSAASKIILEAQPRQTARFAELAYMNQLANQSVEKNTAQNRQSQNPVLFDTTNSHMARLQQFMLHTGETQSARPNQEQFIRQFENLLARSTFQQLGNGIQQLNVKLHPASLGRLDITIQQVNGVLVARLMTTTTLARELIEGQLQHLRNAFQGQSIQVDKIEVTQQQNQQLLKDPTHDGSKKEHEKQQPEHGFEEDEEKEIPDFSEFLEETMNLEV